MCIACSIIITYIHNYYNYVCIYMHGLYTYVHYGLTIHTYINMYVYVHVHTCIHTCIYTHTHTHIIYTCVHIFHRMKTNLQYCAEMIPTLSTQLRIIASVKDCNPDDASVSNK